MASFEQCNREREQITDEQRKLLDTALAEKRDLNALEKEKYQDLEDRFIKVTKELNEWKASIARSAEGPIDPGPWKTGNSANENYRNLDRTQMTVCPPGELRQALQAFRGMTGTERDDVRSYLIRGMNGLKEEQRERFNRLEMRRTLQSDKDVVGGFLVMPESFQSQVIGEIHDLTYCMQKSTIIVQPAAMSISFPVLDDTVDAPSWTAELATGKEDDKMDFQKLVLYPKPLSLRVRASNTLIRRASNAERLIRGEMSYKFATTIESSWLEGTGNPGFLGLFTASDSGISTARDISTSNSSTEVKADNLISTKYELRAQYRASKNCAWIMNRSWLSKVRMLKDGSGAYLWKQGLGDKPDTLLEIPVLESEYAPSSATSGSYVAVLGDLSQFYVVIALDMTIAVLTELYAETNETGYIGRMELDGCPVRESAFVRSKLA